MILAACIIAAAILLQPFVVGLYYFIVRPKPILPLLSEEEMKKNREQFEKNEQLMQAYLKKAIEYMKADKDKPWEKGLDE